MSLKKILSESINRDLDAFRLTVAEALEARIVARISECECEDEDKEEVKEGADNDAFEADGEEGFEDEDVDFEDHIDEEELGELSDDELDALLADSGYEEMADIEEGTDLEKDDDDMKRAKAILKSIED